MFQLPPKTCPHCQKDFVYFDKRQEILFCPHCQNSLLAVPPLSINTKHSVFVQFFQFYIYGIKRHVFLWFFISSMVLAIYWDKEWLYFAVFAFWIIGVLLAVFNKKLRKYFDTLQYQHHRLTKGMDKIGELSEKHFVEKTLQNLYSGSKSVCCPNCTSQRLKSLGYQVIDNKTRKIQHLCLKCDSKLAFNQGKKSTFILYFMLILVMNVFFQHYFIDNMFGLIFFAIFCFTTSNILEFIDFKRQDWQ